MIYLIILATLAITGLAYFGYTRYAKNKILKKEAMELPERATEAGKSIIF